MARSSKNRRQLTEDDMEWGEFCANGFVSNVTMTAPVHITAEELRAPAAMPTEPPSDSKYLSKLGIKNGGRVEARKWLGLVLIISVIVGATGFYTVGMTNDIAAFRVLTVTSMCFTGGSALVMLMYFKLRYTILVSLIFIFMMYATAPFQ